MLLTSTKLVNASLIITQCLNIILQKYASPEDVIVLTTDRPVMNLKVMRFDIRRGKILSDLQTEFPNFYVIEIPSATDLKALLAKLVNRKNILLNSRGRFLFIGKNFSTGYLGEISSNFLINSIFLETDTKNIYKFDLYRNGIFRRNGGKAVLIGQCGDEFIEFENFFEIKIPRRGEEHEMTVGYLKLQNDLYREYVNFKRPGLEKEIMVNILEYLNINYSFTPMTFSQVMEFGMYEDFVLCSCQIRDYFFDEGTTSYNVHHMKFLVPVPEQIERWRYILMVFSPICWILFLSGFTSILITTFLVKYTDLYSDRLSIVQVLYVIFLGRTKRFRTKDISLDILIFCIVFWSVMFNYLFSSKLTYLLNGISYEKGIETTEDIAKNQFFIVASSEIQKNQVKTLPEFQNYPDHLFIPWPKIARYWGDIPDHDRRVIMMNAEDFRLEIEAFTNKRTGLKYLKELEPPFMITHIMALFKRGHPFFDHFNRHLQYFIESGLSRKIIEHYEAPKWEQPTMKPIQKLGMEHMQAPLMILAVGLMLSLIVFFFELTKWKYTTTSTR